MFLLFFLLWVLFNGRWTTEIALFGVGIAALLYLFCCKFLDYSPRKDAAAVRKIGKMFRYLGTLVKEIVKSNLALTKLVLGKGAKEIHPQLVTFRTPVTGPIAKSVLADSITITPGTLTVTSEGDELTVHCLDRAFAEGIDQLDFQRQLLAMEEKGGEAHDGD